MSGLRIGVLARAPIGGRCKPALLAAHEPKWIAGLYGSMLRDTLDGLQSLEAEDYVVFAEALEPEPGTKADAKASTADVLARHVPAPWRIVVQEASDPAARVEAALASLLEGGGRALLSVSDAPSCPTEPLAEALAEDADAFVLGPSDDGGFYAVATRTLEPRLFRGAPFGTPALLEMMRVRCNELALNVRELPTWYDVDRPSDVLRLLDELRRHPERAPRTAQFLVSG